MKIWSKRQFKPTMNSKLNFYNIYIDSLDYQDAKTLIERFLEEGKLKTIFFLNAHYFNLAQQDKVYLDVLNSSELLLNDGIGVKLGAMLKGVSFKSNMAGTDFIPFILNWFCSKKGKKVFFLGGKPGVVDKVVDKNSDLNIGGYHHGYFCEEENNKIIGLINSSNSDFLVIGMGSPKQEKWIHDNKGKIQNVKVCICGGAILDFMSGSVPRAPKLIRKIGLEWLFRLSIEPKRLFARYVIGNFIFLQHVLKHRYRIQ